MTTKHTPTPWEASQYSGGLSSEYSVYQVNGGDHVGDIMGAEAEANAEFIVRAVNSHSQLSHDVQILRQGVELSIKMIESRFTRVVRDAIPEWYDTVESLHAILKSTMRKENHEIL